MDMSKLVIVDGNAILHRAFHAIPPLTTPKQEPINAVYGFVSILLNVIQNLKPTHITVCFDEKEKTFRQEALPSYQAQRPPMADELSSQFAKARKFLESAKIPVYSKPGYEADDVIGTIATQATQLSGLGSQLSDKGLSVISQSETEKQKTGKLQSENRQQITDNRFEVVIITGDRDILQLVDDKKDIKLFMPVGGISNGKLFGETETVERLGVGPKLIPDYKGLVGDASDNYFGVPGIGPKTAINLLNQFGDFQGIYKNFSKIPEKLKEKLEKGKEGAELSYKLATIIRDVPVKFDFKAMEDWKVDSQDVLKLFNEFGFNTLTERIKKVGKEINDSKQSSLF